MIDEAVIQRHLIAKALDGLPPIAREAALSRSDFLDRQGLKVTLGVTLGDGGPSFHRDRLYGSIRQAISSTEKTADLDDIEGRTWTVCVRQHERDEPVFTIEYGELCIRIDDHSVLSPHATDRTEWLQRTISIVLPPMEWSAQRTEYLEANVLTDEAFVELMVDIESMPARLYNMLQSELRRGGVGPHLLVPACEKYYHRLIGSVGLGMNATEYVERVVGPMVDSLVRNYGVRGLRYAVLCCSHLQISTYLPLQVVERQSLLEFFEWLAKSGDPISRIGSMEAALRNLDDLPELEPYLERIVDALLEDADDESSSYAALSAMIALAGSELARRHVLSDAPPFYRRQASIAQASLVLRAFRNSTIETVDLVKWARDTGCREIAFLQSLIDLRREPRYLPEYMNAVQLRAEILGRVRIAGAEFESNICSSSLRARIVGPDCTVADAAPWPRAFLPGPLEGDTGASAPLPKEFRARAQEALNKPSLNAQALGAAIDVAFIYRDVDEFASLASDALKRVDYLVHTEDDVRATFATAIGLAVLAATARSQDLANTVRILTRCKRNRGFFDENPEDEVRIALTAGAALTDKNEWGEFVGGWITEIAFALKNRDRTGNLLMMVQRMSALEPSLLPHVSRAEAAFSALQRI